MAKPTRQEIDKRAKAEGWINTPDYDATLEKYGYKEEDPLKDLTINEEDILKSSQSSSMPEYETPTHKTSSLEAALVGFGEGATLGLASKLAGTKEDVKKIKEENPGAFMAGDIGSYLLPAGAPGKIAKGIGATGRWALKKAAGEAAKKLPAKLAKGALEGGVTTGIVEGAKDLTSGDKIKTKELTRDVALGAAGGLLGEIIPVAASGLKKIYTERAIGKAVPVEDVLSHSGLTPETVLNNVSKSIGKREKDLETAYNTLSEPAITKQSIFDDLKTKIAKDPDAVAQEKQLEALTELEARMKNTPEVLSGKELVNWRKIADKYAKFDAKTSNETRDLYKMARQTMKEQVDNELLKVTDEGAKTSLMNTNEELVKLYNVQDALEKAVKSNKRMPPTEILATLAPLGSLLAPFVGKGHGGFAAAAGLSPLLLATEKAPLAMAKGAQAIGDVVEKYNPLKQLTSSEEVIKQATKLVPSAEKTLELPLAKKLLADIGPLDPTDDLEIVAELIDNPTVKAAFRIKHGIATAKDITEMSHNTLKTAALNAIEKQKQGLKDKFLNSEEAIVETGMAGGPLQPAIAKQEQKGEELLSRRLAGDLSDVQPKVPPKKGPDDLPTSPSGGATGLGKSLGNKELSPEMKLSALDETPSWDLDQVQRLMAANDLVGASEKAIESKKILDKIIKEKGVDSPELEDVLREHVKNKVDALKERVMDVPDFQISDLDNLVDTRDILTSFESLKKIDDIEKGKSSLFLGERYNEAIKKKAKRLAEDIFKTPIKLTKEEVDRVINNPNLDNY